MDRKLKILFIVNLILSIIFFTLYKIGYEWSHLYSSFVHKISRSHVIFVHFSIGTVLIALFLDIIFFWRDEQLSFEDARKKLHYLAHILLQFTLSLGFLMELIERYPNSTIQDHIYWGILGYFLFLIYSFLSFKKLESQIMKCFKLVYAFSIFLLFTNTARIGGILQKGVNFFY